MVKNDRKLPNWLDAFMLFTENTEPPDSFRLWTGISVIAAALQRKVRVNWGTSLTFYPNLYIVLVGPSATGKGTAMNPGLDLISEIPSIKIAANATSLQALIRRLKETNLTDIDMVTGEQQYHSSMTIYSKEFTVFLGYHNHELMSTLCDWYDCDRRWSYETISRKKEEIVGVWVNLIAGTTPDLIQSSLPIESIGGGLTSRIIFVYEESRSKIIALPTQTGEEIELQQYLIHDLERISMLSGSYRWTEDFSNKWADFCYTSASNPPFYDSKFDGYMGRRRGHVMKLSMIMSAAKAGHDLVLTSDDFDEAVNLLTTTEKKMPLVFKGFGRSDTASMMHKSITFLKTLPTKEITIWQFARHFKDDMDEYTMNKVFSTLEAMKMIRIINRPGADNLIKVLDMDETV
jgi:hypothetical protein